MIEKYDEFDFRLICDHCGDECDELFNTFQEAVEYKTDRDNGWVSVKNKNGEWQELCPDCNKGVVIAEMRGEKLQRKPPKPENMEGF